MSTKRTQLIDFKWLKAEASIVAVLDKYGITATLRQRGKTLVGPCPICHGEGDRFRVSPEKNLWNCFGSGCDGGNVIDFVVAKEAVSVREAAMRIIQWLGLNEIESEEPQPSKTSPATEASTSFATAGSVTNKPLGFSLSNLNLEHPYLAERGLTEETIRVFGLGYCDKGIMRGRVVVPIHNSNGDLVAYLGRWPGEPPDQEPRYKLPKGFAKTLELFNLHRARQHTEHPLVIVESSFSAMLLHQAGFPRVVALLGSSLSETQQGLLLEAVQNDERIVLALDADERGKKAQQELLERLSCHAFIRTVSYPEGLESPDHLTIKQVADVFGCFKQERGGV